MSNDNVPVDQMRNLGLSSNSSEHVICGPLLRYIGIDYARGIYRASCLIVATDRQPPPLIVRMSGQQQTIPYTRRAFGCISRQVSFLAL